LRAESPDELRREAEAQLRRTNRLAEREQILEQREREHERPLDRDLREA
jgi:hypothetical protein